jgi:hypothetical protein
MLRTRLRGLCDLCGMPRRACVPADAEGKVPRPHPPAGSGRQRRRRGGHPTQHRRPRKRQHRLPWRRRQQRPAGCRGPAGVADTTGVNVSFPHALSVGKVRCPTPPHPSSPLLTPPHPSSPLLPRTTPPPAFIPPDSLTAQSVVVRRLCSFLPGRLFLRLLDGAAWPRGGSHIARTPPSPGPACVCTCTCTSVSTCVHAYYTHTSCRCSSASARGRTLSACAGCCVVAVVPVFLRVCARAHTECVCGVLCGGCCGARDRDAADVRRPRGRSQDRPPVSSRRSVSLSSQGSLSGNESDVSKESRRYVQLHACVRRGVAWRGVAWRGEGARDSRVGREWDIVRGVCGWGKCWEGGGRGEGGVGGDWMAPPSALGIPTPLTLECSPIHPRARCLHPPRRP